MNNISRCKIVDFNLLFTNTLLILTICTIDFILKQWNKKVRLIFNSMLNIVDLFWNKNNANLIESVRLICLNE